MSCLPREDSLKHARDRLECLFSSSSKPLSKFLKFRGGHLRSVARCARVSALFAFDRAKGGEAETLVGSE